MWYLQFSSCGNGAFLLVEATVCCLFYYWSEIEVIPTKIVMQSAYTNAIERSLLNGMGMTAALRNWVLLLSCDYVLKFDWYCQLSGSGSNSLNSRKFPGRFSYGLGTMLGVGRLYYVEIAQTCNLKEWLQVGLLSQESIYQDWIHHRVGT